MMGVIDITLVVRDNLKNGNRSAVANAQEVVKRSCNGIDKVIFSYTCQKLQCTLSWGTS